LTTTVKQLNEDVEEFSAELSDLTRQNEVLKNSTLSLQNLTWVLGNTTFDQNSTISNINETVANLTDLNIQLDRAVDELVNTTELLINLDETTLLNETSKVADLIDISDSIQYSDKLATVQTKELSAHDKFQLWDCGYTSNFQDETWVKDGLTLPIAATEYDDVEEYINVTVANFVANRGEACLSETNFWEFFNYIYPNTYPDVNLTSKILIDAIDAYATNALSHYFPETGQCGVTVEEWHNAGTCTELNNTYLWSQTETSVPCAL